MVCGSLNPSMDGCCNFCGCFAGCCCPKGREQCCDVCNHCFCCGPMCCEMCPCGASGCIGYPNHLCGCCGNCNLMWYADCCAPCLVADLFIATDTGGEAGKSAEWSNIMCNFAVLCTVIVLLNVLGSILRDLNSICQGIANIVEMILHIYLMVVFGVAASRIAKQKGLVYEPQDCCNTCYNDSCFNGCMKCCTSLNCCCAFCCCEFCHLVQVARTIENDSNMQDAIMSGRPDECQCCNCWKTANVVQLTTSGKMAV